MNSAVQQSKLVVISGPSGVGKSTLCRRLLGPLSAFLSVSATTRTPGKGEINGTDYLFCSIDQFEQGIRNNEFLEYAQVFGNYYGTPAKPVREALAEGKTAILEIDVQGGLQTKQKYPNALLLFIAPPQPQTLLERMEGRSRGEDDNSKNHRLRTAEHELEIAQASYDRIIVNDNLDRAAEETLEIIRKHQ